MAGRPSDSGASTAIGIGVAKADIGARPRWWARLVGGRVGMGEAVVLNEADARLLVGERRVGVVVVLVHFVKRRVQALHAVAEEEPHLALALARDQPRELLDPDGTEAEVVARPTRARPR